MAKSMKSKVKRKYRAIKRTTTFGLHESERLDRISTKLHSGDMEVTRATTLPKVSTSGGKVKKRGKYKQSTRFQ